MLGCCWCRGSKSLYYLGFFGLCNEIKNPRKKYNDFDRRHQQNSTLSWDFFGFHHKQNQKKTTLENMMILTGDTRKILTCHFWMLPKISKKTMKIKKIKKKKKKKTFDSKDSVNMIGFWDFGISVTVDNFLC